MYHVCMPFAGIRFCLRRQWGSHPLGLGWQKINILMHKSHVLFQSSQTILIIYVHTYHACLCTMCVWVSHSHCDGIIMKLFLTHFLLPYHASMYMYTVEIQLMNTSSAKSLWVLSMNNHTLWQNVVQCNLDYLDLVYPDPWLSRLAGDQKMHYYACAEGVASDLLWVWSHIEWWATDPADLAWAKLAY